MPVTAHRLHPFVRSARNVAAGAGARRPDTTDRGSRIVGFDNAGVGGYAVFFGAPDEAELAMFDGLEVTGL